MMVDYTIRTAGGFQNNYSRQPSEAWPEIFRYLERGDTKVVLGWDIDVPAVEDQHPEILTHAGESGYGFCTTCLKWYRVEGECTSRKVFQKWGSASFIECPKGHTVSSDISIGADIRESWERRSGRQSRYDIVED
mgnify:CR=1 FL=1